MGAFCINAFGNSILPLIYRGACKSMQEPIEILSLCIKLLGQSVVLRLSPLLSWLVLRQTTTRPRMLFLISPTL